MQMPKSLACRNFSLAHAVGGVRKSADFAAALEVLVCLAALAAATLSFLLGWLSCPGAAIFAAVGLLGLIGLAWKRFEGGRHPGFFFLCALALFQGGRLLASLLGGEADIQRITLMTWYEFGITREVAALALGAIALSAICIYAPCRWGYHSLPSLRMGSFARYHTYLYVLFWLSQPVQLYKNYKYYEYASEHGGYLVLFLDHGGMADSIPAAVRAISLISMPAFVGIFVLERRKKYLAAATAVYLLMAAPIVFTGSRGAIFSLVLSLWYVAKIKSSRPPSPYRMGLLGLALVLMGALIGSLRLEGGEERPFAAPAQFLSDQGSSLNLTEIAIAYRGQFRPYLGSYLAGELQSAFVAPDQAGYVVGKHFNDDMARFLNPIAFQLGHGTGSAYVAEAYLLGGLGAVILISLLIGALLDCLHALSGSGHGLFLAAMILPDMFWMPRAGLLDWVSALARIVLSLILLQLGWCLYRSTARIASLLWRADSGAADACLETGRTPALTFGENP